MKKKCEKLLDMWKRNGLVNSCLCSIIVVSVSTNIIELAFEQEKVVNNKMILVFKYSHIPFFHRNCCVFVTKSQEIA